MRAVLGGLGVLFLAATGCADLDPLALNACGNQVLETGEDCDRSVSATLGENLACGVPGSSGQCRYVCSGKHQCPKGWGCGNDGVCRAPSADFDTLARSELAERPDELASGDFDGDGHQDVVGRFPGYLTWMQGDGTGTFASSDPTITLPATGRLLAADLDGDGRGDVTAPGVQGLEVWRGALDGPPLPVAYAPFPLGSPGARLLPLRSPLVEPEALIFALYPEAQTTNALLSTFADGGQGPRLRVDESRGIELLAPDVGLGDLNGDATDDVAIAFTGATGVSFYSPYFDLINAGWRVRPLPGAEQVPVAAPMECGGCSRTIGGFQVDDGVRLADLDDDGALDLLVSLTHPEGPAVAVAHGTPGGGFGTPYLDARFASLAEPSPTPGVANARRVWPLALGRGTGPLVVVGANGVYELTQTTLCRVHARLHAPHPWTHATVTDLDGDGDLDVAAIAEGKPFVDVLRQDSSAPSCAEFGAFTESHLSLPNPARALAAGHLNGNAGSDLVVVTSSTPSSESSLHALWSQPFAWPEPQLVTALAPVQHVTTGLARYPGWPADSMDDVWVTTNDGSGTSGFGILSGTGAKNLTSPFHLYHHVGSSLPEHGTPRSLLSGHFFRPSGESDGSGLLVLGQASGDVPFAWPLKLRAHADLAPLVNGVALRPAIDAAFDLACARFAAGDFDGDGRDESVGLFGASLCPGASQGDAEVGLVLGAFADGASFERRSASLRSGPLIDLLAADLDGDSLTDLVLVEAERVRVLWGGEAMLESHPVEAPLPTAHRATVLRVNASGAGVRLAIATAQGVWTVAATGPQVLDVRRVAEDVLDVVEGADVDGDGLEDVVGISDTGLTTLRALPEPPLGEP